MFRQFCQSGLCMYGGGNVLVAEREHTKRNALSERHGNHTTTPPPHQPKIPAQTCPPAHFYTPFPCCCCCCCCRMAHHLHHPPPPHPKLGMCHHKDIMHARALWARTYDGTPTNRRVHHEWRQHVWNGVSGASSNKGYGKEAYVHIVIFMLFKDYMLCARLCIRVFSVMDVQKMLRRAQTILPV